MRVTRAYIRLDADPSGAGDCACTVIAFEVTDTGIGIPPGEAAHHFRGLPAGRRQHQSALRRNRSGACDQPRAFKPSRRRNPSAEQSRRRAAPSPSICPRPTSVPRGLSVKGTGGAASEAASGRGRLPQPRNALPCPSDDRAHLEPDDAVLLIVEDDPHYARIVWIWRTTSGSRSLSPAGAPRRSRWRGSIPADGDLARRLPARHARVGGAEPVEAGPADPAHPGADHHARRGLAARAGGRRFFLRQQADDDGRTEEVDRAADRIRA